MTGRVRLLLALLLCLLNVTACWIKPRPIEEPEYKNVLVYFGLGHNSLSSYLKDDIAEIKEGYVPSDAPGDNVLLLYSKLPVKQGNYSSNPSPILVRLYKKNEVVVSDTLKIYEAGSNSASAESIREMLTFVQETFPAKGYGAVMSSHATGWLPTDYYAHPGYYKGEWSDSDVSQQSFGSDNYRDQAKQIAFEINITDLPYAFPMKMDYILFDACLMGGVEVAYQLKDAADYIGFSAAEIMAEGFNYRTIGERLLAGEKPDPQAVCRDFFEQYQLKPEGNQKSATISLVDCSKLDAVAKQAAPLIDRFRDKIKTVPSKNVQGFGGSKEFYFDLIDILRQSGADVFDLQELLKTLGSAVVYKEATDYYYSSSNHRRNPIKAGSYCGMTMYLPSAGTAYLDGFYKTLDWNEAVSLVK